MPRRFLNLEFPMAGVIRRYARQKQSPYSTPYAQNVFPDCQLEYRERGGSRPGFNRFHGLTGGQAGGFLKSLFWEDEDGHSFFRDDFNRDVLTDAWGTFPTTSPLSKPTIANGVIYSTALTPFKGMTLVDAADGYELTGDDSDKNGYVVAFRVGTYQGKRQGTVRLYVLQPNTGAETTNGAYIDFIFTTAGTVTASCQDNISSGPPALDQYAAVDDGFAAPGWAYVHLVKDDDSPYYTTVSVYWRNVLVGDTVITGTPAGNGIAVCLKSGTSGVRFCVDSFYVAGIDSDSGNRSRRDLICIADNGTVKAGYGNDVYALMKTVGSSIIANVTDTLEACQRTQYLYIADHGPAVNSGTGGALTGTNKKFTFADSDLGADGNTNKATHVLEIFASTDEANLYNGVYKITGADGDDTVVLDREAGPSDFSGGTASWRLIPAAKEVDLTAGTTAIYESTSNDYGTVPAGCRLCCLWRDRIVLASPVTDPHIWYMSRSGDPNDWDYGADPGDLGKAVAGNNTEAGELGEPITALIPHSDDCLILGAEGSLWIMRGDPAAGGTIACLSHKIGVVGAKAWCYTPDGELIFLSKDGIYGMPAGCGSTPQSISREYLPDELLNIDPEAYQVVMGYDMKNRGIYVFLTIKEANTGTGAISRHWYFDWDSKGFWPFTLQPTHDPFDVCHHSGIMADDSGLLFLCRDGYVRRFERDCEEDDGGNKFTSKLAIGPLPLGQQEMTRGGIVELEGVLGDDSGVVDWDIKTGDTPQAATPTDSDSLPLIWTGTLPAGRSYRAHPRAGGIYGSILLSADQAGSPPYAWQMESVSIVLESQGRIRT